MKRLMEQIDGKKLEKILSERGIGRKEASVEIGFSEYFIGNCILRNTMNTSAIKGLELRYNIKPDDFVIHEEKEEVIEPEKPERAVLLDYEKLYQTIYCAVYEAVKKAWSE